MSLKSEHEKMLFYECSRNSCTYEIQRNTTFFNSSGSLRDGSTINHIMVKVMKKSHSRPPKM